jgi:hypothetical protein
MMVFLMETKLLNNRFDIIKNKLVMMVVLW